MPATTAYANNVGTARRNIKVTTALPQTTQSALFTVSGQVRILGLGAYVTTAIQNQANNAKYVFNPTTGTDVDLCAVGNIQALAVNTSIGITGTLATALQTGLGRVDMSVPQVVGPGTIDLSCSASNTGALTHWVIWEPMTGGGNVT